MPQRFLRPGITESDNWNACSFEAQSLYVRLLTLVDDFGRYDGRIPVIHAHAFALRPDIKPLRTAALRSELVKHNLIDVYSVEGKEYLQLLRWQERTRSERSKYPDPQDSAAERRISQEKDASLVHRSSTIVPRSNDLTPASLRFPAECGKDFEELFRTWVEFRKGLGKKPKNWSMLFQAQLDWIKLQPKVDRREILHQSIRNGWQGLFPVKQSKNGVRPHYERDKVKIEPSQVDLPDTFKIWAMETYPEKRDEISSWHTWSDVPKEMHTDWWTQQKRKMGVTV